MTGPLYRLGRIAASHWKVAIPLWFVFVIGVVLVANSVGRPTNNNLDLPGTGSTRATQLLERGLPKQANGSVPIVLEAALMTLAERRTWWFPDSLDQLIPNRHRGRGILPRARPRAGL